MLKISTRIFAAAVMAALLVALNTGAFACDVCAEGMAKANAKTAKTATKTAKPTVKTVAVAKVAPKTAKKSVVKLAALQGAGAKTASTKIAPKMCPMCEQAKADAKK